MGWLRMSGLRLWLAALWVLPGCGAEDADRGARAEPHAAAAPAPIEVTVAATSLVFRYLDPATGEVATASSLEAVPQAARRAVVVYDTEAPPPAGWDHVADLSRGLPAQTQPRQGFAFEVATRPRADSRQAVRQGPKQVVLFSTRGCGYCKKARSWFARHKVPFTEYDVEANPKAPGKLAELGRRAGVPANQLQGVPIIFVDGTPILGWDERMLQRLVRG
ncbi:MAG: hypothetical protein CSA66_02315 [Proteobacteria bacterium]|nr:MAG: hypothetical protein CSA66_02315 [Pseudomonadota bacterium]